MEDGTFPYDDDKEEYE